MKIFSAQLKGTTTVVSGSTASITGSFTGSIAGIDINETNQFTASTIARLSSIETISSSNDSRVNSLEAFSSSIFTTNTFTSSTSARLNSIETISASNIARLTSLESTSASVDTLNTTQNSRLSSLESITGSLATTGSNFFSGSQTITGSLYISADLIVQGSSSLQNITASAVSIGTNIINLNTANPAIRYAGLSIGDSGSIGSSGSFLYDSVQDEMIFIHRGANTTVTSSVVLMGPQTFDNIGSEIYPTSNYIQKGTGNEHLVDSNISDDGTTIKLPLNTEITGSLRITGSINAGQGRFKEWYTTGTGLAIEMGVSSTIGNVLTFDRTLSRYYPLQLSGGDGTGGNASYIQITTSGVGIGSATPAYTLDVSGNGRLTGAVIAGGALTIQGGTGLTKHYFTSAGSGDALNQLYDNTATVKIQLYTNGNSYFNGGKVGIGTVTPQASLHIAAQADTTGLMIGAANGYEIFITGSDSANIYHASPNEAIYLNTNGGQLHFGTSNASTLLTISGSNVGIGISTPTATLQVTGPNAVGTFFNAQNDGAGGAVFSRINASSFPFNQYIFNNGNVGINTTSPNYPLHVYKSSGTSAINVESVSGQNSQYRLEEAGVVKFAITYVPSDATTRMYFAGHGTDLITLKGSKVGIHRVSPLATLSVYGGAFQLMGDYAHHQTIIKNAATAGTLNGSLTITVPDMAGAAGSIGYGGFSCEVYVAGYNAMYCHAWFSGYTNNGVTPSETAILRSSGGWSVSQFGTGSQGLVFVIDYPASIIHPTARIIINKGGHSYENEYPANSITTVWT
jgi:hypothetical protein